MIRTLHILTSLHRRGAETFAVQMIDRLDRARFSPHIWPTRSAHSDEALVPARTPVLSNGVDALPLALWDLQRVLRTVRPHLIQCHGGRALKYAMALKPIFRPHAYVYNKILSIHPHLDGAARRLPYRFLFEQVDAIVAVGEELRREVEETFHPRRPRVVAINNGRDVRPFLSVTPEVVAARRRELGLDPADVCLMQIGIAWEKDPQVSLNVFAELASRFRELRLVFVGEGPLLDDLRRESVTRGLADRVRVLGVRRDVPALLAAADIVLMPSITEGLPGVLIEAGMAGRPAVAYEIGSVRDVLDDGRTGYVVPRGNPAALSAQVARLVRYPALRERMGLAAMMRCRRDFDIAFSVRKYEALFSELVSAGGARLSISREAVTAWLGS